VRLPHPFAGPLAGPVLAAAILTLSVAPALLAPAAEPRAAPAFERDIQPLLQARCLECHGEQKQAGLDLRFVSLMRKGGASGPGLAPGSAARSRIYQRVANGSMPPDPAKRLTPAELARLRDWINAGARSAAGAKADPAAHWAFQVPRLPPVPRVRNAAWVRTPIDAFVLARLEAAKVAPPPAADRRTLLRRAYLDLLGMPPTPAEQDAFLQDAAPDAWERVVDGLLARPEYGERWGRRWLDVARYAETNGYERDGGKPSAWRYRDWVINSLNADKPFDRFLTEQLAGDEVDGTNAESQIAATFLRLGTWDDEPAEPLVDRCEQMDDVLGTAATAFLGVTLRCARCHDHKFEPFSQRDYYAFAALFEPLKRPQDGRTDLDRLVGTPDELADYERRRTVWEREVVQAESALEALAGPLRTRARDMGRLMLPAEAFAAFGIAPAARSQAQRDLVARHAAAADAGVDAVAAPEEAAAVRSLRQALSEARSRRPIEPPRAYVWYEDSATAPPTRLLHRGDPAHPREEVRPGFPAVLARNPPPPPAPRSHSTGRRLWLARWLTAPDNPLTARVAVNRVWQGHFGEGLVPTENDFGLMGQPPLDQPLLDWLAVQFRSPQGTTGEGMGWSLKRLHRLILRSSTYRAASAWEGRAGREVFGARWRTRRLEAEAVRDSILAVSGQLNPARGGPSVYPAIPRAVLEGQSRPGEGWGQSPEREAARRSVYIYVKRALAVPELEVLDAPDTTASCEQRPVSTIAPQALTFLNGDFIQAQSRHFAARLRREAGAGPEARVRRAFLLAMCRPPSEAELQACVGFLKNQEQQIRADESAAGRPAEDAPDRALAAFCLVLLNSNEFVYW
jgi:hypothetical protein